MGKHYSPEELRAHALAVLDGDTMKLIEQDEIDALPALADNEVTRGLVELAKDGMGIRAVKLTLAGYSQNEIAEKLQISRRAVRTYIRRVMVRTAKAADVDELRGLELKRLNAILQRLWPLIDPDDPDKQPSMAAIDRFMKIHEARRAMMGLDKPKQIEVDIEHRGTVHAELKATKVNLFMDLADTIKDKGIGSGRPDDGDTIIDGVIVEDEDEG